MRIIRICTNYPIYLKQFYSSQSNILEEPYDLQYKRLMADCYGWADFWTYALGPLGYEVWEPVANAEPMQKKWSYEYNVKYEEENWLKDILTAQVKYYKPDIIFSNDYNTFDYAFYERLRDECPSIRLILGWCGAPYSNPKVFNAYDIVLTNIPRLLNQFIKNGHRCEHVNHAFNPSILDKLRNTRKKSKDFTFVGSIIKYPNFHNNRERLLEYLVRNSELKIYADLERLQNLKCRFFSLRNKLYHFINFGTHHQLREVLTAAISRIENYSRQLGLFNPDKYIDYSIVSNSYPPLFGLSMYQLLSDSKITLNSHIDISFNYASNMRLFEATGVGTCLLTERQQNLRDIFEPDQEVVTYNCPEEAAEKVRYLLSNDDKRKQIANAGQQRTLKNHTFEQRALQIDEIIRNGIRKNKY